MRTQKGQKRLTQAEYASHRGIAQSTVAKIIRKGRIDGAFEKKGHRYLIDPIKADAILEGSINSETDSALLDPFSVDSGQPQTNGKHVSFAEAVRREKIAKAALLELRLGREGGELIERKRV